MKMFCYAHKALFSLRNLAIIAFMSEGLKSSWTIDASENIGYLSISPYKVNAKMNSTLETKCSYFIFQKKH